MYCPYKFQASGRSNLCLCKLTDPHRSQQSDDQRARAENIAHCLQGLLAEGKSQSIFFISIFFLAALGNIVGHTIMGSIWPNRHNTPVECAHAHTQQPSTALHRPQSVPSGHENPHFQLQVSLEERCQIHGLFRAAAHDFRRRVLELGLFFTSMKPWLLLATHNS